MAKNIVKIRITAKPESIDKVLAEWKKQIDRLERVKATREYKAVSKMIDRVSKVPLVLDYSYNRLAKDKVLLKVIGTDIASARTKSVIVKNITKDTKDIDRDAKVEVL